MSGTTARAFEFTQLGDAPLLVGALYRGGNLKTATGGSGFNNDPISRLLGVRNQGGIRVKGGGKATGVPYVVLTIGGAQPDWPDRYDDTTGHVAYFGDNKKAGHRVGDLPGNKQFENSFGLLHNQERELIPLFLIFEETGLGREHRFIGAAAPGFPGLGPSEDLVPRWYGNREGRFQNYEAHFTVMDIDEVTRPWLDELLAGLRVGPACPKAWRQWVKTGHYTPLVVTPRPDRIRTKAEQRPAPGSTEEAILAAIHGYFGESREAQTAFEKFAGKIFEFHKPGLVGSINYTRPYKDGGRDAVGEVIAGVGDKTVIADFALEAKCYAPSRGCGTELTSRLLGRLRTRMFGVFVTTGYIDSQAYKEARLEDRHPVVFLSGGDIVEILREHHPHHGAARRGMAPAGLPTLIRLTDAILDGIADTALPFSSVGRAWGPSENGRCGRRGQHGHRDSPRASAPTRRRHRGPPRDSGRRRRRGRPPPSRYPRPPCFEHASPGAPRRRRSPQAREW